MGRIQRRRGQQERRRGRNGGRGNQQGRTAGRGAQHAGGGQAPAYNSVGQGGGGRTARRTALDRRGPPH